MLILAPTTDKLRLLTGSAGQIDVHASWLDNIAGGVQPGRTNTPSITTATTTDVVGSPTAGVYRAVKTLHVYNRGSASNTVAVIHTDGATAIELYRVALPAGATLQYVDEVGFLVPDTIGRMQVKSISAAYTVTLGDRDAILNLNGTFSLSLPPAAVAGTGFVFRVRNISATTTTTIDPDAAETIDGKATLPCCAKEEFLVCCDGANWITLGRNSLVLVARSLITVGSTIFDLVLPPDFNKFEIELAQVLNNGGASTMMSISLVGAGFAPGYYWQRAYGFGSGLVADSFLNQTPVQLSATSGVPSPDFDASIDLWPDPMVNPRTASFHFKCRSTYLNDGTSILINVGGWAAGTTRANSVRFNCAAGTYQMGQWTLRGQIP